MYKRESNEVALNNNELDFNLNKKSFYIQSSHPICRYFVDSSHQGNICLFIYDTQRFQKWEFQNADSPGIYYIKNLNTGFYISSVITAKYAVKK